MVKIEIKVTALEIPIEGANISDFHCFWYNQLNFRAHGGLGLPLEMPSNE